MGEAGLTLPHMLGLRGPPIIGSPDVFRLRKEPINSLSYVRTSVRAFRSYSLDRSIFFSDFLHQVVSPYDLDDHQRFFWSKNFLTPKMAKNGQNLAIFGQNSHFWVFLAYNFQTPLWIFLIFGMEVVLMVFFEKIILYMPGKFWYGEILALLRPKFGHFWPK